MKLKDKKIEIVKEINTINFNGYPEKQLQTVLTLWAHFRQLKATEKVSADALQTFGDYVFTINFRKDIDTHEMIRFDGKLYDIAWIDRFEGYRQDIKVYCKLHE